MTCVRRAAAILAIAACSACSSRSSRLASTPASAPTPRAAATPAASAPLASVREPEAGTTPSTPSAAPGPSAPPAASTGVPPPPSVPGVKVTLADVGLEAGSLDRTTDPCVDFYQFACGGWIQNNPIPSDLARWTRDGEIDERNKAAIKTLLDDAAKGATGSPTSKKLGAFYASCMDEAAIERAGTSAFASLVARTRGVKDARTWLAAVIELHKLGIHVVWENRVFPDRKDSTTNLTYLDAAGLGLPDRDYYVKLDFRDKLDGYRAHVGKLLAQVPGPGKLDPADVVAIETEIARLTRTAAEQQDVAAAYSPTDIKALGRQVRSVDWPAYWKGLGAAPSGKIILGTPRWFAALDKLRAKFKPAQWASYFTYHLVQDLAFAMPRPIDDTAFELTRLLTGVEKQRERSKRCVEHTAAALGELLGQAYVASYFPASSRQGASKLVDAVVRAMTEDVAGLDWMTDATKQLALAKLAKLVRMVGYPERWRTYDFDVKRDDFAGNALRAAAFEVHRELARAGKPVDRGEWRMDAFHVDTDYNVSANSVTLPAGILQPPFFGQDRAIAANLGGIGMLIGHELTHGLDDQGAQFDGAGNLVSWWQKDDLARFADKGKCVADQYSAFEVLPKKFIQGQLTLGENIADLGGVKLAFRAYRELRKDAAKLYVADGFSEDQQFFLGVGQAWCARERPAETERWLTVHPTSPPKFRVFGALRNLPEFSDAFHCVAGTPMRPARTCSVW
jgi:putative endopeptidase